MSTTSETGDDLDWLGSHFVSRNTSEGFDFYHGNRKSKVVRIDLIPASQELNNTVGYSV